MPIVQEFWERQPPGAPGAYLGLYRNSFSSTHSGDSYWLSTVKQSALASLYDNVQCNLSFAVITPCRFWWPRRLRRGSATDRLLGGGFESRRGHEYLCCVFYVKTKKAKCRTIKTKTQVRMNYRVQEKTRKSPTDGRNVRFGRCVGSSFSDGLMTCSEEPYRVCVKSGAATVVPQEKKLHLWTLYDPHI